MLAVLCLAGAVLAWPSGGARRRLRALNARQASVVRRLPAPRTALIVVAAGAAGWWVLGVAGALSAALAAATLWRRRQAGRTQRSALSSVEGLAEAVGSLVSELAAGAHPADAADRAAEEAEPAAARAMRAAAGAVRLGGDVPTALDRADTPAVLAGSLRQVGRAWQLAGRHGLPLADVLGAVGTDLDQRGRFSRQVIARMAGPRASATVLAALPPLGVLLGEAMGAGPLDVFADTGLGQALLVTGTILLCAGIAWTARLTTRVVIPR